MLDTPLTLAALATSAVPGLNVSGARTHTTHGDQRFTSAVLTSNLGELIIRIPATPAAEVQQAAELLTLAAFAEGARSTLPFQLPHTLGTTRAGDTRAVVSTFLAGRPATFTQLESDPSLLRHLAQSIATLHQLPVTIVRDAGLPAHDADQVRDRAAQIVNRAAATGLLPAVVRDRWHEVLQHESIWSFETTITHGALAPELLMVEHHIVSGVLDWSSCSLGDPAIDLAWCLAANDTFFESVTAHYTACRAQTGSQQELSVRARFYHELELAQWLLHGIESHRSTIIDDAVAMFDRLVDRIELTGTSLPSERTLAGLQGEHVLAAAPAEVYDARSETAELESLDEDRLFAEATFTDEGSDAAASRQSASSSS